MDHVGAKLNAAEQSDKNPPRTSRHRVGLRRPAHLELEPLTPIFRWAGSKRKLLPRLAALWNSNHERYIEPFAGSACLFFYLRPAEALLSDTNSNLVDTYRSIARYPKRIYHDLCEIPRDEETYYKIRNQWSEPTSARNRAVRFLYLNRNCFNGIFRTNGSGQFNVPMGKRPGGYPPWDLFYQSAQALRSVSLRACDFGTTLRYARRGDLVYLDPPYAVTSRRVFRQYGRREFQSEDTVRLARHLERLNKRGVDFVLSYADSREARLLANGWPSTRLSTRRHVAGFADDRRQAHELLISNVATSSSDLKKRVMVA